MNFGSDGITYSFLDATDTLSLLLRQLEEEGYVSLQDHSYHLSWNAWFDLQESPEFASSLDLLNLPTVQPWRPVLSSRGALPDTEFRIFLAGWISPEGRSIENGVELDGPFIRHSGTSSCMPRQAWETLQAIRAFAEERSRIPEPDSNFNRQHWSLIRSRAVHAEAQLSDFLKKTIVLTPERLDIELRRSAQTDGRVVEIAPGFDDQPAGWLETFDRLKEIPARYDISDGSGLTQIIIEPEVASVLREIKRMPGRRVAGERAQAFIRNPFTQLGPDANKVLDEAQIEKAVRSAGIYFSDFSFQILRDDAGIPSGAALQISAIGDLENDGTTYIFEDADDILSFTRKILGNLDKGLPLCSWKGFELEISEGHRAQLVALAEVATEIKRPQKISAEELLDISNFSDRILGFGQEHPYYSPYISRKKDGEGWIPENIDEGFIVSGGKSGKDYAIALTDKMDDFQKAYHDASQEGVESFSFPGLPEPVSVINAGLIIDAFDVVKKELKGKRFNPRDPVTARKVRVRHGLIIKANVDAIEYLELRGTLKIPSPLVPVIPQSLRPEIQLKDHQRDGIAWLQSLWSQAPKACRGALLADDMGLGKTLQLLTFMVSILEDNEQCLPFLVVAPVSLLENWKEEIEKFFVPEALPVLTLYGRSLTQLRVPKEQMTQQMEDGSLAPKLLRKDWRGNAKVVLTTYETLRDLEFALALEKWSAVVCDEAQKIKNPSAMVTRAAKKQNALFRIACTGTPVENTLTDIWCLFDFIQPGLLGSLSSFGKRYRRPIETNSDSERKLLDELRGLIEPQILRRTKRDVAKDLPRKIEEESCKSIKISERQRLLYVEAVRQFKTNNAEGKKTTAQLKLIQYFRRICSDPPASSLHESTAETLRHSPKLRWLLEQLATLQAANEKALVFCELRSLQRVLQHIISERFGFVPEVINGDTTVDASHQDNRQGKIHAFQKAVGFKVIILSPLAVGCGVNIQAANHVIHFTRTWNPAKEDQATDRAYRIGQTRDVRVYYPLVVADDFVTFDQKLHALLDWKRGLSDDMLNGVGDVGLGDFQDLKAPDGSGVFA